MHFTSQLARAIDTVSWKSRIARAGEPTHCVGASCVQMAVIGTQSAFVNICRTSGNEYSSWYI